MRCHVLHAPEFICCSRFGHEAARLSISSPGSGAGRGLRAAGARPPEVPDRRSAPSGMTPRGKSSPGLRLSPPPSGEAGALCGWRGGVRPGRGRPPAASIAASPQHRGPGQAGAGVGCGGNSTVHSPFMPSPFPTGSGSLFRACPARARPARRRRRGSRAGLRARGRGRTSPVGFSGVFRNGAARPRSTREAAPESASLGPIIPQSARCQAHIGNKI